MRQFLPAAAAAFILTSTSAFAHVTLEQSEAAVDAGYKAVFRVPHGCEGSPTLKLRVALPEGVLAAKPQPKAGWTLDIVKGKYDKPYKFYGHDISEGAKEIVWTGNLPDEYYDEFVLNTYLAADLQPGTTLYFPVVQECEKGVERWIEIPAAGQDHDALESPAPGVKLLPKAEH